MSSTRSHLNIRDCGFDRRSETLRLRVSSEAFGAAAGLLLAQDVHELNKEVNVESERQGEDDDAGDGEIADAVTDGAEVFDHFLLFEGVAVGGFADALELIFDALEGGDLFLHLAT